MRRRSVVWPMVANAVCDGVAFVRKNEKVRDPTKKAHTALAEGLSMACVNTVSLAVGNETVADIQLWGPAKLVLAFKTVNYVGYVDHTRLPLHLLVSKPHNVYSSNSATTAYFAGVLRLSLSNDGRVGVLGQAEGTDSAYAVFYFEGSDLKCTVIDFAILTRLAALDKQGPPMTTKFVDLDASTAKTASNTTIFDKVLSNRKSNQYTVPKPQVSLSLSSLTLTSSEQISQALNKVILSGLRLRGLSSNSANENDRIAVKEIYLMVRKSAMFAIRKYNYGFQQQPRPAKLRPYALKLNDIQTIVEQLLQVFIDVDEIASPKPL